MQQLDQLVLDVAFEARKRFPSTPMRVWWVMLGDRAWKGLVINTESKLKLVEGPVRTTLNGSLKSLKSQVANMNKTPKAPKSSGS